MEASIVISGGGIIGNYISLRLSKSNISSVIIEKSEESFSNGEGIRTLTLNDQSLMMLKDIGINPLSSPINEINVIDGEGTGKIQFSSKDISTNSLSHVVVFNDLRDELIRNECDLIVHSWKDLPIEVGEQTKISATLKRSDMRDILFVKKNKNKKNDCINIL